MRAFLGRLHPHDRIALALLLPVWLIGFALPWRRCTRVTDPEALWALPLRQLAGNA